MATEKLKKGEINKRDLEHINLNDIKLIATDMDGTLLDSEKNLPPDFLNWVNTHKDIKTVLASGRQYFTLKNMFHSVEDDVIFVAENGAIVFEKGEILYCNKISREDVVRCLELLDGKPGIALILCGAKSAYMKHGSDLVEENGHMYYAKLQFVEDLYECLDMDDMVKIAVFVEEQKAEPVWKGLPELGENLLAVLSGDSWIDIANKSVSKGEAIEVIQKRLNITRQQSMAFGDYLNDYDLLCQCEESYAMENAHPKLKKIAKHITDSNDEQGVMKVLNRF